MTKRQEKALADVRAAASNRARGDADLGKAIRVAVALGLSFRTVAEAAGVGHTTVARKAKAVKS